MVSHGTLEVQGQENAAQRMALQRGLIRSAAAKAVKGGEGAVPADRLPQPPATRTSLRAQNVTGYSRQSGDTTALTPERTRAEAALLEPPGQPRRENEKPRASALAPGGCRSQP